jgi:RNA polymerase sigma factor (sigma-70 family)
MVPCGREDMHWDETIETEMVHRACSGDQNADERLYRRHLPSVRAWCLQITRNVADADDLTQEVFMRLFLKLPAFRRESSLRSWLYRVAVNCALMHLRKRGARATSIDAILEVEASVLAAKLNRKNTTAASAREHLIIDQAVGTLTIGKRSVFILHDVSGFRHKEIAERLGLSIESSKSRLRRARKELGLLLTA